MPLNTIQRIGLAGGLLAGAALLVALASEFWLGHVPCTLCLLERWPYRVAILCTALCLASPRGARLLVLLAGLAMLGGAALGVVHVGVEAGAWPSPLPGCSAPDLGRGTVAERMARLPDRPAKPCDEPTYLLPAVPVSMATAQLVLSALLGLGMTAAAATSKYSSLKAAR